MQKSTFIEKKNIFMHITVLFLKGITVGKFLVKVSKRKLKLMEDHLVHRRECVSHLRAS